MLKFLGKTLIVSAAVIAIPIVLLNQTKRWIIETRKDKEFQEIFE